MLEEGRPTTGSEYCIGAETLQAIQILGGVSFYMTAALAPWSPRSERI